MKTFLLLGVAFVVLLILSAPASGDSARTEKEAPAAPAKPSTTLKTADRAPAAGAGLIAIIDLSTGKLIALPPTESPNVMYLGETQNPMNFSFDGLEEVQLPDGHGVLVDLKGRFQSTIVAVVGADGKLRMGHPVASASPSGAAPSPETRSKKEGK